MSILINKNTKYLIQGITGKEGARALNWMTNLGSKVVAGVTPGKGGQTVQDVPVYNSVAEAVTNHPEINATCIYAPPRFVLAAAKEVIASGIELIHIIAENIPTRDTVELLELAKQKSQEFNISEHLEHQHPESHQEFSKQIKIIGPSSIGVLSPGKSAMGSLGAGSLEGILLPFSNNVTVGKEKGGVVVLSKSGGMSLTISHMISSEGVAVSTVVGLGGDKIACTAYADLLELIKNDSESWAVVLVGEIGGSYEEDFALKIKEVGFSKPVVAFISGKFAEYLPTGVAFGHAGAIVSKQFGTRDGKIKALKDVGVLIADKPEDIVELLKTVS